MTPDPQKPRFEPPPWEKDAFDRFQEEQKRAREREELDAALKAVRETPTEAAASADEAMTSPAAESESRKTPAPAAEAAGAPGAVKEPSAEAPAQGVSDARVNSMLVQLRVEERPVSGPNMRLIDSVAGVLGAVGLLIIIQGARLFSSVQVADPAARMLGATLSFALFLTGIGFIGGAILLFRKYHT